MTETSTLITITEAARITKKSRPTLYKLIREGKLHVVKVGRWPFLDIGELRAFIK